MNKMFFYFHAFKVRDFYFGLLWTKKGLVSSTISNDSKAILQCFYTNYPQERFQYIKSHFKYKNRLIDHFNGIQVNLCFPLDHSFLSSWQSKISLIVRNIPYGKCVSYKDIANSSHKPFAYRAVGNALKRNRLLLIVPCHRVISNNGSLGGFSKGLKLKKYLLSLES